MMNLGQYLDYKNWADEKLYRHLKQLAPELLETETLIVFKNILSILNHVYQIDRVWINHLQQQQNKLSGKLPNKPYTFDELTLLQKNSNKELLSLYESLDENELGLIINFKFLNGKKGSMQREAMIMHLVNHATYHRGHVASMLYVLGEKPPITDLPVFLGG